ncbi:aminoglycoside phosphotransferase family protein [Isoptericola jiangsuensis]|uniref:aminoglycoside phosphotransferase family protein n=1 Tax=Isoptericola jiangsuensis TaxID=548579 RepID=UPI003AAD8E77
MAAAEIEIDVALVRALLAEQHPDLAGLPLRVVAQGWDNVMARLGDDLVVRVPRRALAAPLVEHEQRWLPQLAPGLPVAVPVPVRVGVPSPALGYPWSWSVVPWFDGVRAADVPLARRRALASPLAGVLRALHTPAPAGFPVNPVRGVPLATRDAAVRDRLASGVVPEATAVEALWDRVVAAPPWDGPPRWLHGDLHPGNLVVTEEVPDDVGRGDVGLVAVADFGDLTAGDPATDLATAWLTFDAVGRATFRDRLAERYPAEDPVWVRARGWAVSMSTSMLTSGPEHAWVLDMGRQALEQVLGDA